MYISITLNNKLGAFILLLYDASYFVKVVSYLKTELHFKQETKHLPAIYQTWMYLRQSD